MHLSGPLDKSGLCVCMCTCPSIMVLPLHLHQLVQNSQDAITAGALCADVSTRLSSSSVGGGFGEGAEEEGGQWTWWVSANKRMTMMSPACRRGNKRLHPLFIWVTK